MPVGDHFRVAIDGGLAGQQIVTTFQYRQSTANTSTLSDVESLARAIGNVMLTGTSKLIDCQSQDVDYGTIESRSFPLPGVPMVGYDLGVVKTGQEAIASLPPSCAAVIKRRTGFLGRKYRGRIFLPGVPVDYVTDGEITDAGYIATLAALAAAIIAPIAWTAGGSPTFVPELCVVVGDGSVGDPYAYRATDIISAVLDKKIRSQRRREVGRGS